MPRAPLENTYGRDKRAMTKEKYEVLADRGYLVASSIRKVAVLQQEAQEGS